MRSKRSGVADNTLVILTSDNGAEVTGEVRPGTYDRALNMDIAVLASFAVLNEMHGRVGIGFPL